MDKKLEKLLEMSEDQLKVKLKEVYENQKLSPNMRKIARILDIVIGVGLMFVFSGIIVKIILGIAIVIAIFRLTHHSEENKTILDNLDLIAECFGNYKKYLDKKLSIEYDEKIANSVGRGIKKYLPHLLKNSMMAKIFALTPILSLFADEMTVYLHEKQALNLLLTGTKLLNIKGITYFSNDNISKLEKGEK